MMVSESVKNHESLELFHNFENALFYCVDPGAYAMFREIIQKINDNYTCKVQLYCQGWAKINAKFPFKFVEDLETDLKLLSNQKTLLVLGSQVDFLDTQYWLAKVDMLPIKSLFVFDHWKNYTNHFVNQKSKKTYLPDHIFVPDNLAKKKLLETFQQVNPNLLQELEQKTIVSKHFSIDNNCKLVRSFTDKQRLEMREKWCIGFKKMVVLFLEPDVEDKASYPGYNTESIIRYIKKYVENTENNFDDLRLVVKPHPRQMAGNIIKMLQELWGHSNINWHVSKDETAEELIAAADEVWGITTVALIVASLMGKTIKSFQTCRNKYGREQSNDYLEPYLIDDPFVASMK